MKIPFKYVVEMICDWLSAAKTYSGDKNCDIFTIEYEWWNEKSIKKFKIHKDTKELISKILWNLKEYHEKGLREEKDVFKTIKLFLDSWEKEYEKAR